MRTNFRNFGGHKLKHISDGDLFVFSGELYFKSNIKQDNGSYIVFRVSDGDSSELDGDTFVRKVISIDVEVEE